MNLLVLKASWADDELGKPILEASLDRIEHTKLDLDPASMTDTDWDRALDAIVEHSRCITL